MRTVGPCLQWKVTKVFQFLQQLAMLYVRLFLCLSVFMLKQNWLSTDLQAYATKRSARVINEKPPPPHRLNMPVNDSGLCTVNIVVMQQALFLFTFCAIFQTATLSCGLLSVKFTLSGCNFIYGMNGRCSK
ncbi:unnamed protein product [Ceratitis capitata]|uniref:(Mediterranean fruit fly) hypothetical protein n=1 Tax=Ceratitis capitata TaxID=7213 RepID=A0A811UIN4_CERCA|nr:unnamed protein product [Ceratitis capitata]